jgi:ATP-dependent Clp protease ATP-binding subunit ClpC
VLKPEEAENLLSEIKDKTTNVYRKAILESLIFNIKTDVAEALRVMSRSAAEKCIEALYAGCIMLNPGLDVDYWLDIAYTGNPMIPSIKNKKKDSDDPFHFSEDLEKIFNDTFKKHSEEKPKPMPKKLSKEKFLGLDNAIETIVSALKRSQTGMNDPNRPLGVFMFAGASGVGKTHLANELHKYIYGSDYSMVRIDCGELQHKHENQKLIGSPPGYIGHEDGGQLINMIKKYPNTVVLLDEVEKAHPDIWNTFLRIFDEGIATDNKGKQVSFRNTVIIMTTNLGNDKTADNLLRTSAGFTASVDYKTRTRAIPNKEIVEKNTLEAVRKHFKPEFINRIDKVVVFNHLKHEDMITIAELEMSIVKTKLLTKGYSLTYTDSVVEGLIEKGIDTVKGARGLSQIRREGIEDKLAELIISSTIPRGTLFEIDHEEDFKISLIKPQKQHTVK